MAARRQEEGWDPPVASLQAPVTFEDVAVRFSAEEWELLEEWQRELHREVTEGTSQLLASLGPPSSPALAALMRLVKEIPEFLFGGPRAGVELGATTSRDTERMGVNGASLARSVGQSPLRRLQECLWGIGIPDPIHTWPAAASGTGGAVGTGTGSHSPTAAGVTVPVVSPQSPTETQVLGASSTAMCRDPHHASVTRTPACPPTMGTVTKRRLAEVGAMSPMGSSACASGCTRASLPKKSDPRGSPPSPRQPLGVTQHLQAAVGGVHMPMAAEELERLCWELGSVHRELCGVRNRLVWLERGWARGLPALTRSHRHLRRCLQSWCCMMEARSWLPHGAGGASAISPLQTQLLRAPAQLRLHGLLHFTNTKVLLQAARGWLLPPAPQLGPCPPHHCSHCLFPPCRACPAAGWFAWIAPASHGRGPVGL